MGKKEQQAEFKEILSDPENIKIFMILILISIIVFIIHIFPIVIYIIASFNYKDDDYQIDKNVIYVMMCMTFIRTWLNFIFDKGTLMNLSFMLLSLTFQFILLSKQSFNFYIYSIELIINFISLTRLFPKWI